MSEPLRASLVPVRVGTALLFLAHAVARIVDGTRPRVAHFMGELGFPQLLLVAYAADRQGVYRLAGAPPS